MSDTNFAEPLLHAKAQVRRASEAAAEGDIDTAINFLNGLESSLWKARAALSLEKHRRDTLERSTPVGRSDSGV